MFEIIAARGARSTLTQQARPPGRRASCLAAPGWKARFALGESDEVRAVTLISWALVEDGEGATEVIGVVQRSVTAETAAGRLGLADEVEGFQGYTFAGLATQAGAAADSPSG